MQIARHLGQIETVSRGQRQHDVVLGRRSLQFEVELAAEAFAQRQPPGAIDPAAERRMDDKLHAARFVEEALQHQCVLGRQAAQRRTRAGQILDQLFRGGRGDADLASQPALRRSRRLDPSAAARRSPPAGATRRNDSSSLRPGASPSQNGMVGDWPRASSTRTMPRSTRMMR